MTEPERPVDAASPAAKPVVVQPAAVSSEAAQPLNAKPVDALHQAGGGATETERSLKTVNEPVLRHLQRIFESHAGPDQRWGSEQIKTFLQSVQHHQATDNIGHVLAKPELDLSGFLEYQTSSCTAITTPRPEEDLSWPLASYFISSSHNTYLSGNQLSSHSTTETYTNVLLRGCRCVEIDVWDGDESDSEMSGGSNSSDEGGTHSSASKRHRRYGSLKEKLPESLTERLEKTRLGKKVEEKMARKHTAAATAERHGAEQEQHTRPTPAVDIIEPRVLHGHTLTKEVSFRHVCTAIRDSAFVASDLPVIVSLEVHCNAQQQALMVSIMKEAWQGLLVPELAGDATQLPAPQELRRKILVKVKYASADASSVAASTEGSPGDGTSRSTTPAHTPSNSPPDAKKHKKKKSAKIIQELSRLAVYTRGVSFKSFAQPEAVMPSHVFSLSEKQFKEYHENQRPTLMRHNRNYMLRAYPAGFRISSSNLNPAAFWGAGAQIVALNWQQTDQGIMLNEGMFAGTGGYVLKPEGFRPDIKSRKSPNKVTTKTLNLSLEFLAAQSIPRPPDVQSATSFRPYVKVELHADGSEGQRGGPMTNNSHEKEAEYKSRTRTHRGSDFDLGHEKVEFRAIGGLVEELTFLRFTVRDDEFGRDGLAAWACVRLDRLGEGYRFVHLMDAKGGLTDGVVLVKVEKTLT